ncbi:MAG TPA: stage II sporulation protein M [Cyclobacteriaceae bacterium]|nr:stage II sporulation protein M [Cyclobacteriaceae bacterium]
MKETRFIAQNKEKWQEAETLLDSHVKEPEKLSNLFIQVVDDLSYSRTYYPNRSVRVYLNKIARQYFAIIYSYKKEKHNQFKLFWLEELPQIILYSKRELLISLLVFLLSLAIGIFSSYKDPQFVSTILGDSYVSMTDKNIESGDPMAVYKQSQQIDMFLGITFNNLMVAFRTYVLGIFMGIGTLASLLHNGIMVGSFQYYFVARGLFIESALSIWLHGTLEISSIILAGGAGLTLASGLIFPGTYSRLQSLQLSGIRSLKLMLGIAPVFVLAAIIESFLTRYTDAPAFLKLLLIILSFSFIIGYFVIYPWLKSRSGFKFPLKETKLQSRSNELVNFTQIKTNADILKDTFQFYSRHSTKILPWIFVITTGVSTASFLIGDEQASAFIESEWLNSLFSDMLFALSTPSPPFILINSLGISIILYRVMNLIDAESKKSVFSIDTKSYLQLLISVAVIFTAIYLSALGIFIMVCCFGILLFIGFAQLTEACSLVYGISHGWKLFNQNKNQGIALQFIIILLSCSFLLVLSAPLLYMHMNILQWNFSATDLWSKKIIHFLEIFIKVFSFYLILPIISASISYLYFSQAEVSSAKTLKESIAKMGMRSSKNNRR